MAGLYYTTSSTTQNQHSNQQHSIVADAHSFFSRLTCVNVNHVSYNNYILETSQSLELPPPPPPSSSSSSFCAYNNNNNSNNHNITGNLPPYHSLTTTTTATSTLNDPSNCQPAASSKSNYRHDLVSSFSLPSSCESPMSLPTFSPPIQHYLPIHNNHISTSHSHSHSHNNNNVDHMAPFHQQDNVPSSAGNEFSLDADQFSLDLMDAGNSATSSGDGNCCLPIEIQLFSLLTNSLFAVDSGRRIDKWRRDAGQAAQGADSLHETADPRLGERVRSFELFDATAAIRNRGSSRPD